MTHALKCVLCEMGLGRKVPSPVIFKLAQASLIYSQDGQHVKGIQAASELQEGQPSAPCRKETVVLPLLRAALESAL